jgi:iron complex outermembrane receptor protein
MNTSARRVQRNTRRTLIAGIAMLWSAAAAAPARAQTQPAEGLTSLSLEELLQVDVERVYSASRFVQDARRAPASVSIITAEDITRFGYRTLGDALRSVVGFYTTYDRNYTYLGVRGFGRPGDYNGRVLLLIDGHRTNDVVYDQALIGSEFQLDLALVERIEVIRGPSSSLYGSSAFFGVVNVITRRGRSIRGVEAAVEGGSLGSRRARVSVGSRTGDGVEFSLSGSAYRSDGQTRLYFPEYDTPETNNGVAEDQDADSSQSVFGQFSRGGLWIEGAWSSREKHVPTGAFDTLFGDPRFVTTDRRWFTTVQYGRRLGGATEAVGRVFVDRLYYSGDYPYESPSGPGTSVQKDVGEGTGLGAELLVSRRVMGRDTATIGVEARNSFQLDQLAYFEGSPDFDIESRQQGKKWAAFGQYESAITPDVLLNVGLRYDHETDIDGSFNPRLGLILAPNRPASLKLLYGKAFRAPNAYEQFYWPGQTRLEPETIHTSEGIFERRLGSRGRLSVAAFYNVINGLISEQEADNLGGGIQFLNADRVISRGAEWALEARADRGWLARIGHTFEDARDSRTDEAISNAPRHLVKMRLLAPLGSDRFTAGLEGEYVGRRRTVGGELVDGFYRQNLTIAAARIQDRVDARLVIGNLFDREYGDVGAVEHRQPVIVQDGRTAWLSVTFRF